jgi:hypothetical protein
LRTFLSFAFAGRKLMMEMASVPSAAKITTADRLHAARVRGIDNCGFPFEIHYISKVQSVLLEIRDPLWFIPNDLHRVYVHEYIGRDKNKRVRKLFTNRAEASDIDTRRNKVVRRSHRGSGY